jgi:hypothetical protein
VDPVDFTLGQFGEHDLLKYILMLISPLFMERRMISHPINQLMLLNAGKRVLEEAVAAPPPKKSKAEKKVVPSPRIEESSEDLDEEEHG